MFYDDIRLHKTLMYVNVFLGKNLDAEIIAASKLPAAHSGLQFSPSQN
jgi:hypothetical protein